jgi:hypothetical protein
MINKEAIKQAKKIPKDERRAKAIENLNETTKLFKESSKKLDNEMKQADKAFYTIVENAAPEHQQKAIKTVQEAKELIEELRKGGNVDDIVKKLKALK